MKKLNEVLIHSEFNRLINFFDNIKQLPPGISEYSIQERAELKETIEILDIMTADMHENIKFLSHIKVILEKEIQNFNKRR